MAEVSLRRIVKRYGANQVVHGVDLDVGHGEFVVLVGPSGCGKSTLLRMIAGLEDISEGELRIDGRRMNEVPPAKREIAMVFQSYALYPHMTVYKNLAFGLETAGFKRPIVEQRVQQAARLLMIEGLLGRRPKALSGGQRQRVAIGRAIVREPKLFLFDEPLSNLDAELRVQMRVELSKLHADLGATMIYVTHDQVEAMTMADRIVVLREGRVEQAGSPLELYNKPANRFVAGVIGSPKMNFLNVRVRDAGSVGGCHLALDGGGGIEMDVGNAAGADVVEIGIRPEHIELVDAGIPMSVSLCEHLGGNSVLHGKIDSGQPIVVQTVGQSQAKRGDVIQVRLPPAACHIFDRAGNAMAVP